MADTPSKRAAKPVPAVASVPKQAPAKVERTRVAQAPVVSWPAEKPAPLPANKPATPARQPVTKKPAKSVAASPRPTSRPKTKSPTTPVAAAAAPKKEDTMNETVKNVADKAQDQAKTMIDEGNARAKNAMEKGQKMFADVNEFAQGNVEAMIESSKIAAKGAEDIAKYSADYARSTVTKANETARRFAAVKSPTELFQLQSEIARDTIDAFAGETAKFTENYLKLVGEVVQPLSNRFALAAEKVKVAA